jgi:hypothetical protein
MARAGQGANIEVIAKVSTMFYSVLFCVQENVPVVTNYLANTFVCRLKSEIGTKDGRHGDGSCNNGLRFTTPKLTLQMHVYSLSFSDLILQSRRGGAESGCVA